MPASAVIVPVAVAAPPGVAQVPQVAAIPRQRPVPDNASHYRKRVSGRSIVSRRAA